MQFCHCVLSRLAMNDFWYLLICSVEMDEVNSSVCPIGINGGLLSYVTMKTLVSLVVTIFIRVADDQSEVISSTFMWSIGWMYVPSNFINESQIVDFQPHNAHNNDNTEEHNVPGHHPQWVQFLILKKGFFYPIKLWHWQTKKCHKKIPGNETHTLKVLKKHS